MKENLKKLRILAGLSQNALAQKLGYISGSAIAMWESGTRKPPSDLIPKIAEVLNCSIEDLFKGGANGESV